MCGSTWLVLKSRISNLTVAWHIKWHGLGGPQAEMGKPLPRLRSAASTWSAFVQIKKDISYKKRCFFLAEQGTQLGEQNAGWVSGPRLTPLCSPFHMAQNAQLYVEDRDVHVSTKDLFILICNQLSKTFISLLTSFSTWKQKKFFHYRIVSAPPKQYSSGTPIF